MLRMHETDVTSAIPRDHDSCWYRDRTVGARDKRSVDSGWRWDETTRDVRVPWRGSCSSQRAAGWVDSTLEHAPGTVAQWGTLSLFYASSWSGKRVSIQIPNGSMNDINVELLILLVFKNMYLTQRIQFFRQLTWRAACHTCCCELYITVDWLRKWFSRR